jgi:succinate dehydrogenase/fumarate reductase flavoprotein subunit
VRTWTGDLAERVDDIAVGSGGAALTAALYASNAGAAVVVLETSHYLGGTTAMSGGMIRIPNNHHMRELMIHDDRDAALRDLRLVTQGRAAERALESFADHGPEMLAFLETERASDRRRPIPRSLRGLFAVGNNSAHSVTLGYAGTGSTLGPGMTMAFVAYHAAVAALPVRAR